MKNDEKRKRLGICTPSKNNEEGNVKGTKDPYHQ